MSGRFCARRSSPEEVVADDLGHGRAVGLGEGPGRGGKLGRAHVVRGGVDQIASQRFGGSDRLEARDVDAVGRDEHGLRRRRVTVAAEAVAVEEPAEAFGGKVVGGKVMFEPPGAFGQR